MVVVGACLFLEPKRLRLAGQSGSSFSVEEVVKSSIMITFFSKHTEVRE